MSATDRQNKLLVAEDWKRIYQSYRNADFQSYDFENLKRIMINYLRDNYPEDFNDYIESSEYLALIDMIAFLGQSISFRIDLNARENFLELADRRESVLRLARLLSYNPKRAISASGLLKIVAVQTTESLEDINGNKLNGIVNWSDKTNLDWHAQFIQILNAALPRTSQFGNPIDKAVIYGVPTEQYRFQASNTDVPIYKFSKSIDGRSMPFEVVSTTFKRADYIYEEPPYPGNSLAFLYRDDGKGYGSNSSGFFINFKQGILGQGTFTITQPSTNQPVDINANGINNDDVWLYRLNQSGIESELWVQVPALEGNNVIYNSLEKNIKNIYSVVTRGDDKVSLMFSDGTFGALPKGSFKAYYRTCNGLSYTINPKDIRNVTISIPYLSNKNTAEVLTLYLSLMSSVTNSAVSETSANIKSNAPATYYTQNRMITGEDYNIAPLSVNQEIIKIKTVNRTASGISRYLDLLDPTGKYSRTNLFSDDGALYKEEYLTNFRFSYTTKTDIKTIIYNQLYNVLESTQLRDYYYSKYIVTASDLANNVPTDIYFSRQSAETNLSVGNLIDINAAHVAVSANTTTGLKYITIGALIKFTLPDEYYFNRAQNNEIVWTTDLIPSNYSKELWTKVIKVSNADQGEVILNDVVPASVVINSTTIRPKLSSIIPAYRKTISTSIVNTIINLIYADQPFGLRYDIDSLSWQVILDVDLNTLNDFNKQTYTTHDHRDSSWLISFTTDYKVYTVKYRQLRYIFESENQVRFYYDSSTKIYDIKSQSAIKDKINVLSINTAPGSQLPLAYDREWEISGEYIGIDGYVDPSKIQLTFADSDDDGVADNPEIFSHLVETPTLTDTSSTGYIVTKLYSSTGNAEYKLHDSTAIVFLPTEPSTITYSENTYVYLKDKNLVKMVSTNTTTGIKEFILTENYKVYRGRHRLKFQYIHNAPSDARIDPGVTNIMDIYVLTNRYNIAYRQWVEGSLPTEPLPPTTDDLYMMMAPNLNKIKALSDEVVYHPVKFKVLFGHKASSDVQAIFKIVKNSEVVISDNDIKTKVLLAIKEFFDIQNWDFGDSFHFSELTAHVMNKVTPYIVNFIIVPKQANLTFGNLFEIRAEKDQVFISGATVDDIEIISSITINSIGMVP